MSVKKNIFLQNTHTSVPYRGPSARGERRIPVRENPEQHGRRIARKLQECYKIAEIQKQAVSLRQKEGVYLEFSSLAEHELVTKSLENIRNGIRLLNVQHNTATNITMATVYIPAGQEQYFLKRINAYILPPTEAGKRKHNDLVRSIENIKLALLESFWTGKLEDLPKDVPRWCEIWIRYDHLDPNLAVLDLKECCASLNITLQENELVFPEKIVRLIKANRTQLTQLIGCTPYIAELKRAQEPTSFFTDLSGSKQQDWVDELLARTVFHDSNSYICLLDTGVNYSHPLILPAVQNEGTIQSVNSTWGSHDQSGHGSKMAGIAIYNDLKSKLLNTNTTVVNHKIESVKILPPKGENPVELYGAITEQAVALAEIANPDVNRSLCMAVTSSLYNTDDGSPTSWSAALDSITSGANEGGEKRLFFVSAGNVLSAEHEKIKYPEPNRLHSIESPGQSWNAITVGAVSLDMHITGSPYIHHKPVASSGELSPYSSTSSLWDKRWPIKPEILLDGGNMATSGHDYTDCEDLSLLTTSHQHLDWPFATIHGTSSATAQAAWMAAQIYTMYPEIWPETVRALLIHSARWTKEMKEQFCQQDTKTIGRRQLLRFCGYGIPNLEKAIQCTNNSVNLIIESELQPYKKNSMNEMHFHKLPWAKEALQALGATEATLRITLSYFIEPGPGEIGWKDKYRYPSCGLRFDVINSNEEFLDFSKRVNIRMRGEDGKDKGDGSSREWYLGVENRNTGSIHSDFSIDVAANLCDANYVAVYPVIGWWRKRPHLKKHHKKIRYSLIVSIETPETEVDLYTPIITEIATTTPVEIQI